MNTVPVTPEASIPTCSVETPRREFHAAGAWVQAVCASTWNPPAARSRDTSPPSRRCVVGVTCMPPDAVTGAVSGTEVLDATAAREPEHDDLHVVAAGRLLRRHREAGRAGGPAAPASGAVQLDREFIGMILGGPAVRPPAQCGLPAARRVPTRSFSDPSSRNTRGSRWISAMMVAGIHLCCPRRTAGSSR